jgi:hypothetical protein
VRRASLDFTFAFEISQPEQIRACRVMHRRTWGRTYLILVGGVLVAVGVHFNEVIHGREGWWVGVVLAAVFSLGIGAAGYFSPYIVVRSLRERNRAASQPNVYRLSDAGLEATSLGTSTAVEWANVAEVYGAKESVVFYISAGWALTLPKRAVSTAQWPSLTTALQLWVHGRTTGL